MNAKEARAKSLAALISNQGGSINRLIEECVNNKPMNPTHFLILIYNFFTFVL